MSLFNVWRLSIVRLVAIAAASAHFAGLSRADDGNIPGLVSERPAEGRFVEIDGRFMVPYSATIPGTDVMFEMVPVPGGEFLMGSPPDEPGRSDDEGPQVRVRVAPFWIGKHEVTWAEYKAYMSMYDVFKKLQRLAANRAALEADVDNDAERAWRLVETHAWDGSAEELDIDGVTAATPLYDASFTYASGEDPDQPAVTMTQFAARQYTKWLSLITGVDYRLPTEAEWEYAARAGTTTAYSFGDSPAELDEFAWFEANAEYLSHPVGQKRPNPWGLYDMHGNVAEWTLDEYQADAYQALGKGPIDAAAAVRWPAKLYPRVIRGGSWLDGPETLRSAARQKSEEEDWKMADPNFPLSPWWYTEEPATGVGMRIVRPLAAMTADEKRLAWEADVDILREDVEDRLSEGRGAFGTVDKTLPQAIEAAEKLDAAE